MLRFVINLDRSVERWAHMRKTLDKFGWELEVERISAVDGRKLPSDQLALLQVLDKCLCPRDLTPSEIGCFLSHRKCWKRLVESDQEWALIMEDDIHFSDSALGYLSSSEWIPKGIHLVQLFIHKDPWKARVSKKEFHLPDGRRLLRPIKPTATGTQAYFISRDAALKALDMSSKLMAPVDEFLFNPLSKFSGLFTVYRLNPAVVIPMDDVFTSTIEKKNKTREEAKCKVNTLTRKLKKIPIHLNAVLLGKVEFFTFK